MKDAVVAVDIDVTIEELEPKITPDGETVLPLRKGNAIRTR
jgi:hypothetical protein